MMRIVKLATGNPQVPSKRDKKQRVARRWLTRGEDKDKDIAPDGRSKRQFEGKGGGFGEHMGENTGGITFSGQGEGYRRSVM